MSRLTQKADSKGRVSLPKSFANSTVVIEQISDRELRICKVRIFPKDEIRFAEENPLSLSDRDRDLFLKLLDQPPSPPAALRHLWKQKVKKRC